MKKLLSAILAITLILSVSFGQTQINRRPFFRAASWQVIPGTYFGTIDRDPVTVVIYSAASLDCYTQDGNVYHGGFFTTRMIIPGMDFNRIMHYEGFDLVGHEVALYPIR